MALEEITDGRSVDGIAQFEQFTFNTIITPTTVFPSQLKHQRFEFGYDLRTSRRGFSSKRLFAPNQFTMPTQNSIWAEDQYRLDICREIARYPPQFGNENSQQHLFEPRKTLRLAYLPLQHTNLLSQQQNLDVFLNVRRLAQSDEIDYR